MLKGGLAGIHGLPIAFSYNGVLALSAMPRLLLVTGTASHICSWLRLLQQGLLLWLFQLNEPRTLQKWVELDKNCASIRIRVIMPGQYGMN